MTPLDSLPGSVQEELLAMGTKPGCSSVCMLVHTQHTYHMHTHMYIPPHTYTAHMYHMHTHIYISTRNTHMCTCAHTHNTGITCTHTLTYTDTHVHTHNTHITYTHSHICTLHTTYRCSPMCMYTHIHIYLHSTQYIRSAHICTHLHIHTPTQYTQAQYTHT